ncbi:hypothetical protein E4U53_005107 [Claviceps sorghi]|nr:hypothetical protein E4U53_005107 [Claviceps sorghi]
MSQAARLNPSLVETHIVSVNLLCAGRHDATHDASSEELSFVQILPAIMDNTGSITAPPVVLTVRSRAAGDGNFQAAQSVLQRWEAVESKQTLDPAFEQLGNRRNSISSEPASIIELRKLDPVVINKVVVGLQVIHFGRTLLLTMTDGSLEYRDRFTFEEAYASQDLGEVMTLRQAGWSFSDYGLCKFLFACMLPLEEYHIETIIDVPQASKPLSLRPAAQWYKSEMTAKYGGTSCSA